MDKRMILILAGVGIGALMIGMAIAPQRMQAPEQQPVESGLMVMEIVATHDATNRLYRIDAEYPQFKGVSDTINKPIELYVSEAIAEFKVHAEENWKARQETAPAGQPQTEYPAEQFTFMATWQPKQINKKYISMIIRVDAYEGGANARSELRTFNYDVEQGKEIALADLFPGDKGYLGKVAKYAYDRLSEDLQNASGDGIDLNMIAEGTVPTRENFKNFVFDAYVIELYFPKYQVAPGVFGEQRVMMSRQGVL